MTDLKQLKIFKPKNFPQRASTTISEALMSRILSLRASQGKSVSWTIRDMLEGYIDTAEADEKKTAGGRAESCPAKPEKILRRRDRLRDMPESHLAGRMTLHSTPIATGDWIDE